ncbi:hypothetical protein [Nonomuraea basaltis]|uniref:hypothetical protein n=1 Tax=Nonomuraea basaltis TaxID=2495887 RepID=UPI00110C4E9E|nr:hypothetical protein [Nonomuraea basaltis]TMR91285.1 hypothetical protein EJK15_50735 [Nonomuraea basaltis]
MTLHAFRAHVPAIVTVAWNHEMGSFTGHASTMFGETTLWQVGTEPGALPSVADLKVELLGQGVALEAETIDFLLLDQAASERCKASGNADVA